MSAAPSRQELQGRLRELTERLREAEEALSAIRGGEVDAIVVSGKRGDQVFSLTGSDSVYRLIVESMQEAALTASRDGRILFCNAQFAAMLGVALETLIGSRLEDLVSGEDRAMLASLLGVSESKPVKGRVHFRGASATIPSQVSASFLPDQEMESVCIVAADLSELEASAAGLRRSNADLLKSATKLRGLAGELSRAEERERRRLASILHDGLQQLLVGAQLRLDRLVSESGEELAPKVQGVVELIGQSIQMSRSLATEISPPIRFDTGLPAALEWLAQAMHSKHGLRVSVTVRGGVDPVSEDIATLLFRSTQELLFNVVKHAGVEAANLMLEAGPGHLRLTVSDAGRGFDEAKVESASGVDSFGLFSIRERLSLVGGGMEMRSEPGVGSSFTLVVPLEAERAARRGASARRPAAAASATQQPAIGILVVDDHRATREGLVLLLSKEPDIRIVGECDEGATAVRLAGELQPDIIVMDVSMPGMNGIEAATAIHAEHPGIRIVGFSMLDDTATAAAMKEAGAVAHVSKSMPPRLLVQSIRAAARRP